MKALPLQENLKKFTDIDACPIRNIISRFSGKWSILILCVLASNEMTRFNAIGKAIPDISPKVLAETLKNLERDNLICRKVYPEVPPRVEYCLSELGRSLMPILENLISWSLCHYNDIMTKRQ